MTVALENQRRILLYFNTGHEISRKPLKDEILINLHLFRSECSKFRPEKFKIIEKNLPRMLLMSSTFFFSVVSEMRFKSHLT